jgi:hypothetical protein
MTASNHNTEKFALISWAWIQPSELSFSSNQTSAPTTQSGFDPLLPIRHWLDSIQVESPELAHRICRLIPAQCPFERTVKLFGRTLLRIPPLCKLNPVYDEVVALRFRALCYLADVCGEDISQYC